MPNVSICTTLARFWNMAYMAKSLSQQTFSSIEWVIVDFNYEINKEEYALIAEHYGITLTHVPNVRTDKMYMKDIARNRNLAIELAKGDIIIFLDDYTFIDKDFVEQHVKIAKCGIISCGQMTESLALDINKLLQRAQLPVGLNITSILNNIEGTYLEDSRLTYLTSNGYPKKTQPVLGAEWTYTGNLAFSKKVFATVQEFDPILSSRGEDGDFGVRADNLGFEIMYNLEAHSINFDTTGIPCTNVFDHEHDVEFFRNNTELFLKDPELATKYDCTIIDKYGVKVLECNKCGADFILNPADYIYAKLQNN